eukprot:jgi/Psemu1/192598/e_gw1.130.18.1
MKKTWVELPSSKYDIEYVLMRGMPNDSSSSRHILPLNPKKAIKEYFQRTTSKIWSKTSRMSPFEIKLDELDRVTRRDGYGDGTAVMYIREIFEPGDAEYDYIGDYVCAAELSREQVDRLRIMILPQRREEMLVSYLNFYKDANQQDHIFNESTNVVRHFEGFHRRYLEISPEAGEEKFDLLFCFTFAIKTYSGWILKFEGTKKRTTMIATLAKHWRKLLGRYTPIDLGLDLEFSYPAALAFLESFKNMCENVDTFGYPTIQFDYQVKEQMRVKVCIPEVEIVDNPMATLTGTQLHAVETKLM